jgi:hypothetical protein
MLKFHQHLCQTQKTQRKNSRALRFSDDKILNFNLMLNIVHDVDTNRYWLYTLHGCGIPNTLA